MNEKKKNTDEKCEWQTDSIGEWFLIRGRKVLSVSHCANKYTKRRNNSQVWSVLNSGNSSNGNINGNLQNRTDSHVEMEIHQIISNRSLHQLLMNESDLSMRFHFLFVLTFEWILFWVIVKRKIVLLFHGKLNDMAFNWRMKCYLVHRKLVEQYRTPFTIYRRQFMFVSLA